LRKDLPKHRWQQVWWPTAVVLAAAALRLIALDHLPPGLFYDESANGIDALRVLGGWHPVFFPGDQGREALFIYLQTATIAMIGPSPLALRLPAAALGILTVAASYATFRAFAGRTVGLLGAFLLAVSYWHVSLSRLAFRTDALPLFSALTAFFLWKGVRSDRLVYYGLAGACLGADLYTYIPARLAPVLFAAWLVGLLAIPAWRGPTPTRRILLGGLVTAIVFAVTAFPLANYFYRHPQDFFERIENAARPGGEATTALAGFGRAAAALVWLGDSNPRHDLPGRPLVDVPLSVLGVVGAAIALRRGRDPTAVFSLGWCLAMLTPAALGDEPAHALRLAGELPFLLLFPAHGLAWLGRVRWRGRQAVGALAALAVLLGGGIATTRDYFAIWPARSDTYEAFEAGLLLPLSLVREVPPGSQAYAPAEVYEGQAVPISFVPDARAVARAFDQQDTFVLPADATRPVYYLYARAFEPAGGIPVGDRLIHMGTSRDGSGQIDGELFRLDPPLPALTPERPASAVIGDAVRVDGSDVAAVLRPGQSVRLALFWTVQGKLPPGNWEFFAHLVGRQQHQVLAQQYNQGFPVDQWRPGDRVVSWFDLAVPPDAPALVAEIGVGIFDRDSGRRLPVVDPSGKPAGDTVLIGPIRVNRPAPVAPPEHLLAAQFGSGIVLDGYDLDQGPDGSWALRLHWRADRPVARDYTIFAHLLDAGGHEIANADAEPGQGAFPTSTWLSGEPILDAHRLQPRAGASPPARVELGLYLLATGQRLPASSVDGRSLGDAVTLPLP
jgi:4-amino-4-deoxy-L-arabinose transferase-like glycosyltransferase